MSIERIGVEIEFRFAPKIAVAQLVAEVLGTDHIHCFEYKQHTCHLCRNTIPKSQIYNQWFVTSEHLVTDLKGVIQVGGELVSPIMSPSNLDDLKKVLEVLQKNQAAADYSTSIQVHLDVSHYTPEQRANIYKAWVAAEDDFFNEVADYRRKNPHCIPYAEKETEQKAILEELIKNKKVGMSGRLSKITSRNRSLNVLSYPTLGTFEVRVHEGTLDFEIIEKWVALLVEFFKEAADGN
jgi:hypothetical protein